MNALTKVNSSTKTIESIKCIFQFRFEIHECQYQNHNLCQKLIQPVIKINSFPIPSQQQIADPIIKIITFCKTFLRLLTKINTYACPTTLLKSQLLQQIHTLLTKIKTFHSFTTKPSVTLAKDGRGEEN